MMKYSISEIGIENGKKKGTTAHLSEIAPSAAAERGYYRSMKEMLDALAKETRESIIPAYQAEQARAPIIDGLTRDVDAGWFSTLWSIAGALVGATTQDAESILALEAARHTDKFADNVKRIIGIDMRGIIRQSDIEPYMRTVTAMNAMLIRNLAEDTIKRIETAVYTNAIQGNSVKTLRAELQKQFGISGRRAQLIARDQIGKFNGNLTRIRQQQAGITEYIWRTSHDERVRPLHRSLDGKRYTWGKATGAEGGAAPGEPVQCRCWADGIVVF